MSGPARSSPWAPVRIATAGRSATGWPAPRTTPAASARSASRAATTCARTTASPGSTSSTATTSRAPTRPTSSRGSRRIFPLPDGLSFDEGAVIDPASIALHVANRGDVRPGDTVAITGAGAIGLLSGDAALIRGAARVILVERIPGRLAKAAELGFETVDSGSGDPVAAVRAMTGGLGVDVVLECAGVPATVAMGDRHAPPRWPLCGRRHSDGRRRDRHAAARPRRARTGRLPRHGRRDASRHAARRAGPDTGPRAS